MKSHQTIVIIGALLFGYSALAELSETEARKHLHSGARVVDVRTVEEFNTKHLPNVINVPVDDVKTKFPAQFTNKSEIILLHCRSGRRSGMAEQELHALGYTNVFNIGSYERAEQLLTPPKN